VAANSTPTNLTKQSRKCPGKMVGILLLILHYIVVSDVYYPYSPRFIISCLFFLFIPYSVRILFFNEPNRLPAAHYSSMWAKDEDQDAADVNKIIGKYGHKRLFCVCVCGKFWKRKKKVWHAMIPMATALYRYSSTDTVFSRVLRFFAKPVPGV